MALLSGTGIVLHAQQQRVLGVSNTSKIIPTAIPTFVHTSPSNSPTPTMQPTPTSNPDIAPITLPTSVPTPKNNQTDSATHIALCQANAEKQKENYIDAGNKVLAEQNPGLVSLANASNNGDTQTIALQYGYIKQTDIVSGADEYQKLINEGNSIDYAKSISESMTNTWYAYLQNLHNWATKQVNDYLSTIQTNAEQSKNDYYIKCLSN